MSKEVVWESTLTPLRVEEAYREANKAQARQWVYFADVGYRAAVARDPKVMKALERMAEVTHKAQEDQIGRTMRDKSRQHGLHAGLTEHQLCREAFRLADEGKPIRNFEWIYGAAAWLAGYI